MGLFDKLNSLLGGKNKGNAGAQEPTPSSPASQTQEDDSSAFNETCSLRDRFWSSVGTVENDVLTHLISPSLTGGPAWPTTRQAYRVIRRDGRIILATDGLSDPFDGVSGGGNGFEMELFLETADIDPAHAGAPGDISRLSGSWAFELIQNVAGTVASAGGITGQLELYGVLSMEIPGVSSSINIKSQIPSSFVTGDDAIGILIGRPAPDFPTRLDGPLSPIAIVPIVLIQAAELETLRTGGAEARVQLAERLADSQSRHFSSLTRPGLL